MRMYERVSTRMKAGLALALFGSVLGCLVPAYCEGQGTAVLTNASPVTAPTWRPTGNLNVARSGHTATLLQNGKVLVVGGGYDLLDSTELYDPATGVLSVTG